MIDAADFTKWLEIFKIKFGGAAASGTVNAGTANEIAYYAADGTAVSGLTTANNGILSTNASGVPAINNTVDLVGQLNVDDLRLDGSVISSTALNADITLTPNGTGIVANSSDITVNSIPIGHGLSGITSNFYIGSAGNATSTGTNNFGLGDAFMFTSLTSGSNNIGIGVNVLDALTSGNSNMCFGTNSGGFITTGNSNVGVGINGVQRVDTGVGNVGIGDSAVSRVTSGSQNAGIGSATGRDTAAGAVNVTTGEYNTWIGSFASSDNAVATGTLALGSNAVSTVATGATSGDDGPGIAIGSAAYPVGFRGDDTIYPSAGTSAGYWRIKINGTQFKILLLADS